MKKTALFLLLVCLLCSLNLMAQTTPSSTEDDYIIGPRDILFIAIWGEETLRDYFEVSGSGSIHFFFLGDVQVAGLTIKQVTEKLSAELENGYIKNPVIIVNIDKFKSKEVQLEGAVVRPGTYVLETNTTTLLKLISMAGGTTIYRGNFALIYRGGAQKIKQQPQATTQESSFPENQPLEGDSAHPTDITTVLQSLTGQENITVDLRLLLDQGKPENDVTIYPGDFVLIRSKTNETLNFNYVFVEGAVRTPKAVEYIQGMTALQAIIQAGGFSDYASPNKTTITRIGPDNQPITIKVRLKDVQKGKRPDEKLQPGDRINVRESAF